MRPQKDILHAKRHARYIHTPGLHRMNGNRSNGGYGIHRTKRAVPTIAVWNLKLFPKGLSVAASDWIRVAST